MESRGRVRAGPLARISRERDLASHPRDHDAVTVFFLTCAILGGGVLVLQLVLSLFGIEHGGHHDLHVEHSDASEGLSLRSVRALAAGLMFFGIGGLAGMQTPLGAFLGIPLGVAAGGGGLYGTAALMRSFKRLEHDGTVSLFQAVGQTGSVYLGIPAQRSGLGKVHVSVQDRLIECPAVTPEDALPTGAPVLVVDVERDTLVVVRNPQLLEEPNAFA
jgi:hypothetical protein